MWHSLTKLISLLSGAERRSLVLLVVLMLFEAMLEMAGVALVPLYITVLAYPDKLIDNPLLRDALSREWREWLSREHLLVWGGVAMFVLYGIKTAYVVFLAYWKARFAQTARSNSAPVCSALICARPTSSICATIPRNCNAISIRNVSSWQCGW